MQELELDENFFPLLLRCEVDLALKVVCMQIHSVCLQLFLPSWLESESRRENREGKTKQLKIFSIAKTSYAMAHIPQLCGHNSRASRRAKLLMNSA
jgi:hypothetical protein